MKHRKNSRKNPRLVKVCTILPSPYVKEIMQNCSINSRNVINKVSDSSFNIRKNSDDNTSLIQKQIDSLRNYVEKSFIILFIVLFLDCLVYFLG